ncbi:FAD-dependent oxidoreductase [Corynebacterium sp. 153RC1]|uniref:FAD-dependent oxidoreductase n=1 Tax=unclassified Corynebacterium TaxID=2624378 RepID=UPI00211C7CB5|nr:MULTISPECIES: FAD-dependent oxidoreductase [unclassified Corynebacterium]MCQ9370267.1 FAD-dependent oxidoreductase [Corynebacterium sp. 35RC1]MCQ9351641.1 FAD-dependent oxidoreductase [Corynebacterium sp. 209RC1]MCQ9354010.1 FAD-dependent oxidoreductase [Corynebacterium sp. 1222RC1]MCQ9355924.1 FAD-dependent oxidoreductase [Corynebacterium sp. 122RC1]MCQ9358168.1 FAD-dependent oxidoreductase [Corynebacterium sp. 142RC1]
MATTVIVGGVAGGMSTATRLRRNCEDREIIVLEASDYVSFANCGLPYHVGGVIEERGSLLLQTPESLKARFNIDVRVGTRGRVVSIDRAARTVTTETDETIAYDELVLSPGATPRALNIPGEERALSLRLVEDMDAITQAAASAKSAVILGGGFIGLELAENFTHLGVRKTVVQAAPHIMGGLDPEMAEVLTQHIEKHGVKVLVGARAQEITPDEVLLSDGTRLAADLVISAAGVIPNSELARNAGLELSPEGAILVDEQQRTSDPTIYALGDAAAKRDAISGEEVLVPLAQTANRHGRLVADVIAGKFVASSPVLGTAIIGLFGMAAASVGWNERRARAAGKNVRVIHLHPTNHAGYYPGASQLHIKVIVDVDTDTLLGAQVIGKEGVDKRIDVLAVAMRAGMKASGLADLELAYAPQFGSAKDPINMVGFINDNAVHGERTIQWHELDRAISKGAILVDVRTPGEHAAGSIPGAVNYSLDDLRQRWQELKGKDVVVHCQVGLRGHIAASLLRGYGIDAANLDGGYLTWRYGVAASTRTPKQ